MTKIFTNDKSGNLFDAIRANNGLTSDRALAIALGVAAPVISKIRHGKLNVGATLILAIHEKLGIAVSDIRAMIGTQPQATTEGA